MTPTEINESPLRIACYNILHGGGERLDGIFKVIEEINPDICGVLEAVGWGDKTKDLKSYTEDLGYKIFEIGKANSKYNIAVLSKIPLKIKEIKEGIQHVILEAVIQIGPFKNLQIFFVHLSPKSEDARLLEIEKLLELIPKSSNVIVMGDFNSLSPHDPYNQEDLTEIFKAKKITKYGDKTLRFDVIEKIESLMVDGARYLKFPFTNTTPTPSNEDEMHATDLRIDYVFLTENIVKYLKKIEILKNIKTEKASDHYPLFIDLKK